MSDQEKSNVKMFKYLPIPFALLGIIYCGFVLLFQVESIQEKYELIFFFLGGVITLLGILMLCGMGIIYKQLLKPREKEEPKEEEVEGV